VATIKHITIAITNTQQIHHPKRSSPNSFKTIQITNSMQNSIANNKENNPSKLNIYFTGIIGLVH